MSEGKPTILQRLNNFRKAITVEPSALLMLIGSLLAGTAVQTLALDKACRVNLKLSEDICDAVRYQNTDDNADNERIVQEYVARIITFKSIITSVGPCLLLIFAGGWMDTTGRRKALMILPVIGEICVQANNIINAIFFHQLRVQYLVYFEAVLGSITGSWSIFFLAIFSYITDITTEKNRTHRLGLVSFSVFIGMPFGVALAGYLLKSFGYLTVFIVSLVLALTNFSYLVFGLSDPVRTKEHKEHDNRGFVYFMKIFFNPAHVLNSLRVLFRKTEDNRVYRLCFLMVAACFITGLTHADNAIMYMSTRYRFGWDELQYSTFQTYNSIINIFGTIFSILVISKALGWHDSVLGILSTSSKICASFVYCFAATGGIFFLGKLNSIVGLAEVVMPLAFIPLYTHVYTATMPALPGAVFLVGACLTIPPLLVFSWLLYRHRRSVKLEKLRKDNSIQSSKFDTSP